MCYFHNIEALHLRKVYLGFINKKLKVSEYEGENRCSPSYYFYCIIYCCYTSLYSDSHAESTTLLEGPYNYDFVIPSKYYNVGELFKGLTFDHEEDPEYWNIIADNYNIIDKAGVRGDRALYLYSMNGYASIYQYSDNTHINSVKNEKVLFYAYVRAEQPASGKIKARITVTISAGSSGGCPRLYGFINGEYVYVNNLLPSARGREVKEDYYLVNPSQFSIIDNKIKFRIVEKDGEEDHIYSIKAYYIPKTRGDIIVSESSTGKVFIIKDKSKLVRPIEVLDNYGNNFAFKIWFMNMGYIAARPNDTYTVVFPRLEHKPKLLLLHTDILYKTSLMIYGYSNGKWIKIATIEPRHNWYLEAIDLSATPLYNSKEDIVIKIVSTGFHKIDYIALAEINNVKEIKKEQLKPLKLAEAILSNGIEKLDVVYALINDDSEVVIKNGDSLDLTFIANDRLNNYSINYILLEIRGYYKVEGDPTTTVYGPWLDLSDGKYHQIADYVEIPNDVESVMLKIEFECFDYDSTPPPIKAYVSRVDFYIEHEFDGTKAVAYYWGNEERYWWINNHGYLGIYNIYWLSWKEYATIQLYLGYTKEVWYQYCQESICLYPYHPASDYYRITKMKIVVETGTDNPNEGQPGFGYEGFNLIYINDMNQNDVTGDVRRYISQARTIATAIEDYANVASVTLFIASVIDPDPVSKTFLGLASAIATGVSTASSIANKVIFVDPPEMVTSYNSLEAPITFYYSTIFSIEGKTVGEAHASFYIEYNYLASSSDSYIEISYDQGVADYLSCEINIHVTAPELS